MAWHQSKWFRILVVLVGLLLVALLAAPYLLSIDRYRSTIVEQLEKETGRDIEIEKLRLHFLPGLHVQVVNLRVKNPRGFPEGDTVVVESVNIGLAFWPLLKRQVEISSIGIDDVEINLLGNEQGQTNTGLRRRARPAAKKPAGEAPAVEVTRVGAVSVSDVKISSGTFWSRERRIYPAWEVKGINLEVEGVDLADPQWLRKLEAGVDLSTIEVTTPSLKEPLRFADGEIEVKNNAAGGDFTLALGELRADGTVKVADLEKPVADFTLKMEELDVSQVAALAAEKPKGAGAGPGGGGEGAGGSGKLLARGTVEVGKIIIPPLSAENVKGNVRLYGNRLEVDPFTVDFYGGRTQGTAYVDLAQAAMPARVNARVQGVNVAQAVAAASPGAKGKLTGTFESDARLNVPLGAKDLMSALTGDGTFAVRNGTFPGMNLEGTLAGMAKFLQMEVPKGDTKFSYFGGDFRIASQRVHSRNLDLKAETLEASLGGSFGFDQTLSYTGSGLLTGKPSAEQQQQKKDDNPLGGLRRVFGQVARQTIGQMRVPFSVTGTFQDPKFLLVGSPTPVR
ncbi:MAG: hypothetical protein A3D93_05920 [Acidobacteria bacterium RIFCSPHIGHO2_12_FULL_67_30]|nr:MAG: hypothetical protein A3D93_05920 [Acidobacteria bacterium RIFCSPHIGHO2_12_FULL_67_30]